MEIEIFGVGYGKRNEDVEIGESYLQESVVNMWESAPFGAFVYFSNNSRMILQNYTKTGDRVYLSHTLLEEEITKDIKNCLIEKGRTIL